MAGWFERDDKGLPVKIWPWLTVGFVGGVLFVVLAVGAHEWLCPDLRICTAIKDHPPWTALTGLAAVPALLVLWYLRTTHRSAEVRIANEQRATAEEQKAIANQQQISARFADAMRLLAEQDKLEARLGAIYSLEQIAKDSSVYCATVVEVLAAFVRQHAQPEPSDAGSEHATTQRATYMAPGTESRDSTGLPLKRPTTDVQAALTVLGRLKRAENESRLDLGSTDLQGADLRRANLRRAYLARSNLSRANLERANMRTAKLHLANLTDARLRRANLVKAILTKAWLEDADLPFANLRGACALVTNLQSANLSHANLCGSQLAESNLSRTFLCGANLSRAELIRVNLTDADLRGADLEGTDLTDAKLKGAKYNTGTKFPAGFDPSADGMIEVDDDGKPIEKPAEDAEEPEEEEEEARPGGHSRRAPPPPRAAAHAAAGRAGEGGERGAQRSRSPLLH